MKVLAHICCGPCALIPLADLAQLGHESVVYYYNPNIHPFSEYERRRDTARSYCRGRGIEFLEAEYEMTDYFRAVAGAERKPERCRRCFALRLRKTASVARELGFDAFTTSLLVSPYQRHEDLRAAGEAAAATGLVFYYRDWRPRYHDSVVLSRRLKMYRQSFCGCVFSEKERILAKRAAKLRRKAKKLVAAAAVRDYGERR